VAIGVGTVIARRTGHGAMQPSGQTASSSRRLVS
jgi:hypothetical protein